MSNLVLIVDDQPAILSTLAGVFSDEGYLTACADTGEGALRLYEERRPDVVFLDVWLPDRDGLETLQALREIDPTAAVVMMSGHGTASTAVKAMKMGACNYLEKPLSYNQTVEAAENALEYRRSLVDDKGLLETLERTTDRLDTDRELAPLLDLPILKSSRRHQKTLKQSTVIYGLGLHSGTRTGMSLRPLPPNSGIHFVTLPNNTLIPANVKLVADTDHATTLSSEGQEIKTVEHLLSALHACGITNLLVKVHGEIPVLDGSAIEFCRTFEEIGIGSQGESRKEAVIDREYVVGGDGRELKLEPYDGFAVSYRLSYPPPIGDQFVEFELDGIDGYKREIAPARTFGFMRDLKMMSELGLGTGGRLDNCILVGEDNVINTELRFTDEFARHKILDIIGDLYLLGYPIRGRVTASLTGHRDNIAILRRILAENAENADHSTAEEN